MKIDINTARFQNCNNCNNQKVSKDDEFFDIQVGMFVITLCPTCFRELHDKLGNYLSNHRIFNLERYFSSFDEAVKFCKRKQLPIEDIVEMNPAWYIVRYQIKV